MRKEVIVSSTFREFHSSAEKLVCLRSKSQAAFKRQKKKSNWAMSPLCKCRQVHVLHAYFMEKSRHLANVNEPTPFFFCARIRGCEKTHKKTTVEHARDNDDKSICSALSANIS